MNKLPEIDIQAILDKCEAVINSCTVDSMDACYRYLYLCVNRIRHTYIGMPNGAFKEYIVRRLIELNNLMQSLSRQCHVLLGKSYIGLEFILPSLRNTVPPVISRIGIGTYKDNLV